MVTARSIWRQIDILWLKKFAPMMQRTECPYDELDVSRRFPHTPMSLPARLLLCEGYRRADSIWYMYNDNPQYDRHEDAHQTAQALACGEFE